MPTPVPGHRTGATASPAADLVLDPDHGVGVDELVRVARTERPSVRVGPAAREAVERARGRFLELRDAGAAVYGTTTGFGPLVKFPSAGGGTDHGDGLIAHLAAGWGPATDADLVRATMVARAVTVTRGGSGLRPEALDAWLAVLSAGLVPWVPEVGSVGASGDLIPLAHCARVVTGSGWVVRDGQRVPATEALADVGMAPFALEGRDALGLVNGTSFCTAQLALAVHDAERLVASAELLAGWLHRLLGANPQHLDERLHAARNQPGQLASARSISEEAGRFGPWGRDDRPLQEIYSIRCAPQVLGAVRDQLVHARTVTERELAGIDDNPVIVDGPAALHGGNFHAQPTAFAADAVNAALVQVAVLADRQLDALCDPAVTGATPLLAADPGPNSGLAGAQITTAALVAEARAGGGPAATASVPTNGGNQDVVPMAPLATRLATAQLDRVAAVLGTLALALGQLDHLRRLGIVEGHRSPAPPSLPDVEPVLTDRGLYDDVARLAGALR